MTYSRYELRYGGDYSHQEAQWYPTLEDAEIAMAKWLMRHTPEKDVSIWFVNDTTEELIRNSLTISQIQLLLPRFPFIK
jgi:hypothetical protein